MKPCEEADMGGGECGKINGEQSCTIIHRLLYDK